MIINNSRDIDRMIALIPDNCPKIIEIWIILAKLFVKKMTL